MKTTRKIISALFVMMLVLQVLIPSNNVSASKPQLNSDAEAAILIDAATGKVLFEQNADAVLPIASMTKLMSEYLVHDAIANKKINWTDTVTVSQYAFEISQNRTLSNVPLELNGKYTVKELYEAMAIYSANGATIALAEFIAGTESEFVRRMNEMAKKLNLTNYKFVNSTGLNNKDLNGKHPEGTQSTDENMLSAKDTATLAFYLINQYPEVLEVASIPKKTFQEGGKYPIKMDNWNWMLPSLVFGYEGMDGLKTGSTPTAGYSFTGTAKRGDFRLISVVMKTKSYNERFQETKKLMDYGFNNFELATIISKGETLKTKATVAKGKEKEINVTVDRDVKVPVLKGTKPNVKQTMNLSKDRVDGDNRIIAPIKKDEVIGTLGVQQQDDWELVNEKLGAVTSYKLVAAEEVDKANFFVLIFRSIGDFFSSVWGATTDFVKGLF